VKSLKISLINMIPKSISSETNQDSEPNLTVNPANPQQMAASAFTLDPSGGPNAPIFVSNDEGNTWELNSILPSDTATMDITLCFGTSNNNLYAGILRRPDGRLEILRTSNFMGASLMTELSSRDETDQPFIQVATVMEGSDTGKDRIYMGINDFNSMPNTSTIDICLDASSRSPSFRSIPIERRRNSGSNGPQVRPAIHSDGTVYAIYYGWRKFVRQDDLNGIATADVVVVRDDKWGTGSNPFSNLLDASDNQMGKIVTSGITVPWHNTEFIGSERVGGDLAIAVNPKNSSTVYIAWTDQRNNSVYTLHLSNSTDRGVTWSRDLRTISNAKNPSIAVNSVGNIGFLYQQHTNQNRWETHFEWTEDNFQNQEDFLLATVPDNNPPRDFLPYNGDYDHLVAVGQNFYGIFSTSNIPDRNNFPNGVTYQRVSDFNNQTLSDLDGTRVKPSIDPFFFKTTI
jgi:hypothetical protein